MEVPPSPRRYVVGDVINVVVEVAHRMNLIEARAVFTYADDESIVFVLDGEPEVHAIVGSSSWDIPDRYSFVAMNEEVTVDHVPGIYRFSYLEFETASLRTIRAEEQEIANDEDNKQFEIVAEPGIFHISVTLDTERTRPLDHEEVRRRVHGTEDPEDNEE
jgi:hypothetical protein